MAVVPINPEAVIKPPVPDPDLIAYLESLLDYAKRGELQALGCATIIGDQWDTWETFEEGWEYVLSYAAHYLARQLEYHD